MGFDIIEINLVFTLITLQTFVLPHSVIAAAQLVFQYYIATALKHYIGSRLRNQTNYVLHGLGLCRLQLH